MALGGENIQIGYIVDDISVTGPSRGTYKVWIPKKHWHPSKTDFSGFGTNIGNLNAGDLELAKSSAEECYPLFPLQSGGALPIDTDTGIVSTDYNNPDINIDSVAQLSGTKIIKGKEYTQEGNGANFKFAQSYGADSMTQIYTMGNTNGFMVNTRDGAPKGQMAKLSIGTKVAVIGNYIINMLPETQNDWISQFAPLNKFGS